LHHLDLEQWLEWTPLMDQWLLLGFVCFSVLVFAIIKRQQQRAAINTPSPPATPTFEALNTYEQAFLLRLQQALPTESILVQGKRFLIQNHAQQTQLIFIFRQEKPLGRDYRAEDEVTIVIYKGTGSIDEIQEDWLKYRKL
jgi:hypothetical protein